MSQCCVSPSQTAQGCCCPIFILQPASAQLRSPMEAPLRTGIHPCCCVSIQKRCVPQDMGMTYAELGIFGTLRKVSRCGPVSMLRHLLVAWRDR